MLELIGNHIDVIFELSEEDYRVSERGDLEIRILKDSTLANPVTVRVTPLTVQMALDMSIISTFQDDDIHSPNRAGICYNCGRHR